MSEQKILVVGSAHIDVIAKRDGTSQGIDHPGEMSMGFGGVGGNVAVKMSSMGEKVRFLTAMPRGGFTDLIRANLTMSAVEPWIVEKENLPQAGFVSIMENGEMMSAVTSAPVEKVNFDEDLIDRALDGVKACFIEANLNKETLSTISSKAFERGIPIFFSCVSEAKADRALSVSGMSILFMNRNEMESLSRTMGLQKGKTTDGKSNRDDPEKTELIEKARSIFDHLGVGMIVTMDKDGILVIDDSGKAEFIETRLSIGASGTTLGAGDAMSASIVSRVLAGMALEEATRASIKDIQEVMTSMTARAEKPGHIDRMIGSIVETSTTDSLTGVRNRHYFDQQIRKTIDEKKDFSIIYCDVDHFKRVNDVLGHHAGDDVLCKIAEIIRRSIRADDYLCRMGGDEFACILPDCTEKDAKIIVDRLRKNELDANLSEISPNLGISLGVIPWDGEKTAEEMIESADRKMYAEKNSRKENKMSMAI